VRLPVAIWRAAKFTIPSPFVARIREILPQYCLSLGGNPTFTDSI